MLDSERPTLNAMYSSLEIVTISKNKLLRTLQVMIIGLKSPGPGCAHRSALAHRDWLALPTEAHGARRRLLRSPTRYSVYTETCVVVAT